MSVKNSAMTNTVKQCWDSRENNVANDTDDNICDTLELGDRGIFTSTFSTAIRICFTVLTQPGTPVSFQGMFIHLLFDFWKLQTPTFSDISHSYMYFTFHL